MDAHTLAVLEFPEALAVVAGLASSPLGGEAVRALQPAVDAAEVAAELARVDEVRGLFGEGEEWGMPTIPDARDALRLLRLEGSVLGGAGLREVAVLLASAGAVRRRLERGGGPPSGLRTLAARLAEREREAAEITRLVDEDGEVRAEASPLLYRTRREIASAGRRIVERLAAFAASLPPQLQVPDASVTVRDGRYVVPVRREGRGEVGGVVHGESGSGATLFVEPPVAIEMTNRLRELQATEAREVHRILREATAALRPLHLELVASLESLVELDSLHARARYAHRAGAHRPTILPAGSAEYEVVHGVHPLLLARGESPVPFSLRMEAGERMLLISGPNTGGKTVLLKAVGLISLLAQSGVIPPVGPGTRLPVFRGVFADIGDEQSIEASLSTFSAHVRNLRVALAGADLESLVLVDEIGSGTDPTEGGALARAVLLELTGRGAFTVATTHIGQLKLLASEAAGVVNASLQFDADRLRPTFRLLKGIPGRSYGLAIARRLGLPEPLLAEAEAALPKGERDVAKLLLELEATEQRLAENTRSLEARLAETERLRSRLEEGERELRTREVNAERRARQQARDLLLAARQEVETAIREVRDAEGAEARTDAERAARRRVEQAAARQRERAPRPQREARTRAPAEPLQPGLRVRIASLGRTGTVTEVRDDRATVEAGGLRLTLPRRDLQPLPAGDQEPAPERSRPSGGYMASVADAHPEVDLRGMRPDEMEHRLGSALDAALLSGLPTFRVIHGKGMGVLRSRVEELLKEDRRIASFRPGERFEGGTGVTVVEFA